LVSIMPSAIRLSSCSAMCSAMCYSHRSRVSGVVEVGAHAVQDPLCTSWCRQPRHGPSGQPLPACARMPRISFGLSEVPTYGPLLCTEAELGGGGASAVPARGLGAAKACGAVNACGATLAGAGRGAVASAGAALACGSVKRGALRAASERGAEAGEGRGAIGGLPVQLLFGSE